jgi:hypothetical protein
MIMDLASLTWDEFIEGEDTPRFDSRKEYRDMLRYRENDITLEIRKLSVKCFMWRGIENGQSLSVWYERTLEAAGAAALQWLKNKRNATLGEWISDGDQ